MTSALRSRSVWVAAALAALAAGCGDQSPEAKAGSGPTGAEATPITHAGVSLAEPAPGAAFPPVATVVDATGTTVTVASIERIVAVNGDLLEVVFALGFGEQVVARDISGTYPPQAEALPSVGYQRTLPAEPIAALDPTLVLATAEAGPPETIDALRALGIPLVVVDAPETLDGPAEKVRAVAMALGASDAGEALATEVDAAIGVAIDRAGAAEGRPRAVALYLRGERVQLVFGPGSRMSTLLEAAGAHDLGADLGVSDTQPINLEALLAEAPDAIVVTTSGLASVGGVEGLLGLGGGVLARTPAGQAGRLLAYPDQLLLGFGPRTGEVLDRLVTDLHRQGGTP